MKNLFYGIVSICLSFSLLMSQSFASSAEQEYVEQYIENALSKYDNNKRNTILNNADEKLSTLIRSMPSGAANKDILMLIHTVVKGMILNIISSEIVIEEANNQKPALVDSSDFELSNKQQELLDAINKVRVDNGLWPVFIQNTLQWLAQWHLDETVEHNYFAHTNLAGESSSTRIKNSGYPLRYSGEVLADNLRTADLVIQWWLDSPVHKDILLSPNATEIWVWHTTFPWNLGRRLALFADQ